MLIVIHNMKKIPLTRGKFALVDDEDFEYLNQWKWYLQKTKNGDSYAVRNQYRLGMGNKSKKIYMHKLIFGFSEDVVDHINRDKLDNRKINLRSCDQQKNSWNRGLSKRNKSGFKGVRMEYGKWRARIRLNNKQAHLGVFKTKEEAAKAYDFAAKKHYGEFAKINFA